MANLKSNFLQRHSTLFVFAGALIVFLTFVVKEGLRDEWQHTATAIETAQYIYEIQDQQSSSKEEVKQLTEAIVRLAGTLERREVGKTVQYAPAREYLDIALRTVNTMEHRFININILASKLSLGNETRQKVEQLQTAAHYFRGQIGVMDNDWNNRNANVEAKDRRDGPSLFDLKELSL